MDNDEVVLFSGELLAEKGLRKRTLPMKGEDQILLSRLTQIVLSNIENEQFGVEDFAREAGVSRSYLHRKLKLLLGKSVSQFIREIRLEEAMKLLQINAGTAAEIAYRVGFNSNSYFHKCFHDYFGYPPGSVKIKFNQVGSKNDVNEREENVEFELSDNIQNSSNEITILTWFRNPKNLIYIVGVFLVFLFLTSFTLYYFLRQNKTADIERSIAVLPFKNLSIENENQYFADGIVEDLLSRLSHIQEFKVISKTSSEMYRKKGQKSIKQIAHELGVNYIVEGSVQKYNDKVRIHVQLINANTDKHIWADYFDRNLEDIFNIQSEFATQVATQLNSVLTKQQSSIIARNRTNNPKAMELYQLGRFNSNKRTFDGFKNSIKHYEQAIALDQNFGLAYAGLADTYHLLALLFQPKLKIKHRNIAEIMAKKAISLDPNLAEAHAVLGSIYNYIDWSWEKAGKELRKAVTLNPNYSTARQYYAEYLAINGYHQAARLQINKATELDPLSFITHHVSMGLFMSVGEFQKAMEENRKCRELSPMHPWTINDAFLIHQYLGNDSLEYRELRDYEKIKSEIPLAEIDSLYKNGGINAILTKKILLKKNINIATMAEWHIMLGEYDKALNVLETALKENQTFNIYVLVCHPAFRKLFSQPRFIEIIRKIGLDPVKFTSR